MAIDIIKRFFLFFFLILIQFFIVQELNFGTHLIRPMPYVWAILILPFKTNKYSLLLIAFATGMCLDIFSDTRGMNAASCTLMAFVKYFIDSKILELDVLERDGFSYLSPHYKGWPYYFYYIASLVFVHHICFFILNYYKWSSAMSILFSALLSTLFTFALMLLIRFSTRKL